jgi:hypothetical protein
MERELWRWAVQPVLDRLEAVNEVIEAQRGLPTPIDPVG